MEVFNCYKWCLTIIILQSELKDACSLIHCTLPEKSELKGNIMWWLWPLFWQVVCPHPVAAREHGWKGKARGKKAPVLLGSGRGGNSWEEGMPGVLKEHRRKTPGEGSATEKTCGSPGKELEPNLCVFGESTWEKEDHP